MKIVITDDHEQMRGVIIKLLSKLPFQNEFIECSSGIEALAASIRGNPDVILMDLLMKEMDGFTAIKKIRESGIKSTIIVVTQFSETEFKEEVINLGAEYFVNKENLQPLQEIVEMIYKGLQQK